MHNRKPAFGMLTRRWLPILLAINLLLLVFYLAFDYQLTYHSDSAVKNLLAQEIIETGEYFPHDWNYANGDLWVFYTQAWILPLLHFRANGFALHVISDLVTAAMTLAAAWGISGVMGHSRTARLTSMAVLSAGISEILAEHVYGQGAYGYMFAMAGFVLCSYWKLSHAQGRARWLWGAVMALLMLQVFWSNPQRGLVFYLLPLLAAAAMLYWQEYSKLRGSVPAAGQARPSRHFYQAALAILAMLAGTALHLRVMQQVHNDAGAPLVWLSMADMGRNLVGLVSGMMSLLDGVPRIGSPVLSTFSVYQALRIVTALAILVLLPWSLLKAFRTEHRGTLFVAAFTAASAGLNLFVTSTTSVADMASPDASVRYLVPTLMLLLIVMAGVMIDRRTLNTLPRAAGLAVLLVLATSAPFTYFRPLTDNLDMPWQGGRLLTRDLRMINFLDSQGLQYGYSTFWNAGKHSVLSGQRIRIRQIAIDRGLPMPMRKLSSNRWYNPSAWNGSSFLLLGPEEMASLNLAELTRLAGAPRELTFEGWHILVFPDNIASHLPDWDTEMRAPLRYAVSERSPHVTGTLQGTPPALVAAPGDQGVLHYGPFRNIDAGSYTIGFDLDTSDGTGGSDAADFGWVDVTAAGGRTLAHQRIVNTGRQHLTLAFNTNQNLSQLEFRVVSTGKGQIILRGTDIQRAPQS